MSIESMMWLFPIVFMIHEFEEIIFLPRWMKKNSIDLHKKIPHIAQKMVLRLEALSTAAFAVAVFEEFILLSVLTLFCVEGGLYSLFAAVTIGYLVHVVIHLAQAMFLRRYIPAVGTGLFTGVYSIFSLYYLHLLGLLNWNQIIFLLPIVIFIIAVNLIFCHSIARRMETRWKA
ncbi:HXXEE domain-containing protein [Pelorhabdus rhamnosifermentans]|uniref:HXXEE domain-containing protein n=1 Tax=Pelorhabdus rhamnosifermentans TaxID=2772457 RepID=UPI001C062CA7|nr:HXXEE domain-containing protein [Pelorhabdus rhamnosifermentans]